MLSKLFLLNGSQFITNFIIRHITFILLVPQEVITTPVTKVARYSGAKKSCSDNLKQRFLTSIQLDRYYPTLAHLWNASVVGFRFAFLNYCVEF